MTTQNDLPGMAHSSSPAEQRDLHELAKLINKRHDEAEDRYVGIVGSVLVCTAAIILTIVFHEELRRLVTEAL